MILSNCRNNLFFGKDSEGVRDKQVRLRILLQPTPLIPASCVNIALEKHDCQMVSSYGDCKMSIVYGVAFGPKNSSIKDLHRPAFQPPMTIIDRVAIAYFLLPNYCTC